MIFYITGEVPSDKFTINHIIISIGEEKIDIDWDECTCNVEHGIYSSRNKGIYFNGSYANWRLDEIIDCDEITIYVGIEETNVDFYFDLHIIEVLDGDNELFVLYDKKNNDNIKANLSVEEVY